MNSILRAVFSHSALADWMRDNMDYVYGGLAILVLFCVVMFLYTGFTTKWKFIENSDDSEDYTPKPIFDAQATADRFQEENDRYMEQLAQEKAQNEKDNNSNNDTNTDRTS